MLGQAVARAAAARLGSLPPAGSFTALPGAGVRGTVGDREITVGSPDLFARLSLTVPARLGQAAEAAEQHGRTAVLVGWDGQARAALVVADQLKPHAAEAVARITRLGIRPLLVTGDNGHAARSVAAELGIPAADVLAGVKPDGKVEAVRSLQADGTAVALVGDGVNDAAALAQADLGMAVGTGADAAIGAADLTLVGGSTSASWWPWSWPGSAWIHLYDPHDPYDPPPPFKQQFADRPYDGEIAYVDQQLGRLFAFLKEAGLAGNTIVVLTADHGESLGEHRELRHGYFIYDATAAVPLIIKSVSGKPRVVSTVVRSIDIAPSILQMLGIPKGKAMQGASLSASVTAADAYSETFYPLQFGWSPLRSLRVGNLKYIDAPRPELFDLEADPKELNNRAAERPAVTAEMKRKLQVLQDSSVTSAKAAYHLTPEQVEKLAKLGYLGNSDAPPREGTGKLPDPKDEIDTFYLINRAGVDAGSGRCDRAVPVLLEVLDKAPTLIAAHVMLGRCYFILEKYEESMEAFRRLQAMNPDNSDASFYIAASQFKLDDLASAQAGFERIVSADPKRAYAAQISRIHLSGARQAGAGHRGVCEGARNHAG